MMCIGMFLVDHPPEYLDTPHTGYSVGSVTTLLLAETKESERIDTSSKGKTLNPKEELKRE